MIFNEYGFKLNAGRIQKMVNKKRINNKNYYIIYNRLYTDMQIF
jgi:hypothetical protein